MNNDLNKALKFVCVLLYANNATKIVTGQKLRFMRIKINEDLGTLSLCLIDHTLTLNDKKT